MSRTSGRRKGFSLVTTAVCLVMMAAALGLALDVGRMYVVKSELQAFADAAAVSAALQLDGTTAGLQRAETVALNGPGGQPNGWNFGTQPVTNVTAAFSNVSTGGWQPRTSIGSAAGYKFVRVEAGAPLGMSLLPVIGVKNASVGAVAFAGQAQQAWCGNGCDPFSPDAPDPGNSTNFGYQTRHVYTIKWAPHGQRKPNSDGMCEGDQLAGTKDPPGSDRGYIDVGQGNGNSSLHDAIVNRQFAPSVTLAIGSAIDVVSGNKHVGPGMDERFLQDTDQDSDTWDQYKARATGNGRRLLHVPINANDIIIGYATFFMQQSTPREVCLKNNDACCAEFVSVGAVDGSRWAPADGDPFTFFRVKLFSGGQ